VVHGLEVPGSARGTRMPRDVTADAEKPKRSMLKKHRTPAHRPRRDEATLMVLDRPLGGEMDRIFLDDLRHAQEITVEAFRARSWLQRVAERGANWLTRLL
jgi:phosphatidylserine/phosphatidylglycerophosphate/cardiolipin synthase-like enzyme